MVLLLGLRRNRLLPSAQLRERQERQPFTRPGRPFRRIIRPPMRYAWSSMVRNLLIVWLINALALLALPYLVPSVQVDSIYTALIAAILLGFVNTLIRPFIVLLTLPATVLTLGLFIFVINGLLFWFVASFVKGFSVEGFWSAFFGAIVYALISWAASTLVFGRPRLVVVRHDEFRG